MPVSTPTISGLTVITDHLFSQMYMVATTSQGSKTLPLGGIIGITVNAVLFVMVVIAIWYCVRRRRKKAAAEAARTTTFPPEEPALQMLRRPTTHELDNSDAQSKSPGAAGANWPMAQMSSPPAYDQAKGRPVSNRSFAPQELPGSTFIHEHHPAFSVHETPNQTSPLPLPRTPAQSLVGSEQMSPVLTTATPRSGQQSPPFVSPVTSPKLPQVGP